jgi:hypothetical protein
MISFGEIILHFGGYIFLIETLFFLALIVVKILSSLLFWRKRKIVTYSRISSIKRFQVPARLPDIFCNWESLIMYGGKCKIFLPALKSHHFL